MEVEFTSWAAWRQGDGARRTSSCNTCGKELGGFNSSEELAWTAYEEGDVLKISCHECTQKYFQEWQELKEKEAEEQKSQRKTCRRKR